MPNKQRPKAAGPRTFEESIGRIWGWIFVGIVVTLSVLLVGKGFFYAE